MRILWLMAVGSCLMAQSEDVQEENRLSSRWVAMTVASVGVRYFGDTSDTKGDSVYTAQHQELLGGEFRFDAGAKYTLQTLFASGAPFTTNWNTTSQGRIYWRQFYFEAKPAEGVEFQIGGLGMEPETFTDLIGYSEDGYLTGEKLALHRPGTLFFDTLSVTYGYLGDLNAPDMNDRFGRLHRVNFRQYLVSKKLGHAEASAAYTDQWGIKTVREGVRLHLGEEHVIDSVRAEFYERTNFAASRGFNIGAGKEITKRFAMDGGYASIDQNFGDLNADAFLHGNRIYLAGEFQVTRALRMFAMVNHGVNNNYALPNRSHVDAGFVYDILKALPKAEEKP